MGELTMLLDGSTAKALAAIVLMSIEGPDALAPHLPFQVEDRGNLWLVKTTPHTDIKRGLRFAQFHVFFRKSDAEILGLGQEGRQIVDAKESKYLRSIMSEEQFARMSVPNTLFEPWIADSNPARAIYLAMLGGFINSPDAAIDYAHALLQAAGPKFRAVPKGSLKADESNQVWRVRVTQAPGFAPNSEVLSFSRVTGRLLSGHL